MTTTETASPIIDTLTSLANGYGKKLTAEQNIGFRSTLASIEPARIREACARWSKTKKSFPTPFEFKRFIESPPEEAPRPERRTGDVQSYVCSQCGDIVPSTSSETHGQQTCEAVYRRNHSLPPLDYAEVRLKGLANCTGSKEHRKNLDDYRASKGGRVVDNREEF